jgi:hypothetical protein
MLARDEIRTQDGSVMDAIRVEQEAMAFLDGLKTG